MFEIGFLELALMARAGVDSVPGLEYALDHGFADAAATAGDENCFFHVVPRLLRAPVWSAIQG